MNLIRVLIALISISTALADEDIFKKCTSSVDFNDRTPVGIYNAIRSLECLTNNRKMPRFPATCHEIARRIGDLSHWGPPKNIKHTPLYELGEFLRKNITKCDFQNQKVNQILKFSHDTYISLDKEQEEKYQAEKAEREKKFKEERARRGEEEKARKLAEEKERVSSPYLNKKICFCQSCEAKTLEKIEKEKKIASISGYENKQKLYKLGQQYVLCETAKTHWQKSLQSNGHSINTSSCEEKPYEQLFPSCLNDTPREIFQ